MLDVVDEAEEVDEYDEAEEVEEVEEAIILVLQSSLKRTQNIKERLPPSRKESYLIRLLPRMKKSQKKTTLVTPLEEELLRRRNDSYAS